MNVRIGPAPDSWSVWFPSDPKQPPWNRFLDEVVECGYKWIELGPPGYLPTDLPLLSRELNQRGLKISASVVMRHLEEPALWPHIQKDVEATGFLLRSLGAEFLILVDDFYMRRYRNRIRYLHLKSIDRKIQKKVEHDNAPYSKAVAMGIFCEPSQGAVDFPAFRDVLQDINYDGPAIVEQDIYPAQFDKPLPIAKRTREYLRTVGIG